MTKRIGVLDRSTSQNAEITVPEDGLSIQGSPSTAEAINLGSDSSGTWFAFRAGVGGTVKVDYRDGGTAISLLNVPNGGYEPGIITKIYSTANGTTATDIVAFSY